MSFKNSASGVGNFGPRNNALLSGGALRAFADIMSVAECIGKLPTQMTNAIMPSVQQCHKKHHTDWLEANTRSYHYDAAGRSSEQAVRTHSLLAEAGLALKKHTATVILDLKKAAEHFQQARAFGTSAQDICWNESDAVRSRGL
eukprot:9481587-Pyramimonas_sp.AAC.1